MPSLRRTLSSPTGRSSPYAHPSCSSSSTSLSTRAGSRGPRRSSGSDTSERRVLADLDWWRVEASQREVRGLAPYEPLRAGAATPSSDSEEELDQEQRPPSPASATVASPTNIPRALAPPAYNAPGAGTDSLDDTVSRILNFAFGDVDPSSEPLQEQSPLPQIATLSISSQGRSSLRRSSVSSTFSDASFVSDASFSAPSFAPSFASTGLELNFGFADIAPCPSAEPDEVPLPWLSRSPSVRAVPTRRSVSYSTFEDSFASSTWSDDESNSDSYLSFNDDDWFP